MSRVALTVAIILTIIIRLLLVIGAPGIALDGYETLTQTKHIQEQGTPLIQGEFTDGDPIPVMPVFHYLLAILSLFIPLELAALLLPNILGILTPIAVYKLAQETTKHKYAPGIAAILSVFTPLLYTDAIQADPLSLAIPLLLFTFYYFIRLAKTPRDQLPFIICLTLLTFTHPIALLLIPAMVITIIFNSVQKTQFSQELAEATLFAGLLLIWANTITFKTLLATHGARALSHTSSLLTIGTLATYIGIIPLVAGVIVITHYFTSERNLGVHAIAALAIAIITLMIAKILPVQPSMLLLSLAATILIAPAYTLFKASAYRSRLPAFQNIAIILLAILFIATNGVTTAAFALETYEHIPTEQDQQLLAAIHATIPEGRTVYWDAQHGHYLTYAGYSTPLTTNTLQFTNANARQQELVSLTEAITDVRIVQALNTYNTQYIILEQNHTLPLSERCFTKEIEKPMEVYKVQCVVQ